MSLLDPVLDLLRGRTITVPPLDGAFRPDTRLDDCVVGRSTTVQNSVGVDAEVGANAVVGPYAYLPAGSHVAEDTVTGAFYTAAADDNG